MCAREIIIKTNLWALISVSLILMMTSVNCLAWKISPTPSRSCLACFSELYSRSNPSDDTTDLNLEMLNVSGRGRGRNKNLSLQRTNIVEFIFKHLVPP